MVKRYELSDAQWERIEGLACRARPAIPADGGDNRLFVNGVLWVLRSGAHWHDLPERYGKWKTRAQALHPLGQGRRLGAGLRLLIKDRDNEYLMLDTTLVRAHQQAATGKGGTKIRLWGVPEAD